MAAHLFKSTQGQSSLAKYPNQESDIYLRELYQLPLSLMQPSQGTHVTVFCEHLLWFRGRSQAPYVQREVSVKGVTIEYPGVVSVYACHTQQLPFCI